MNVVVAGSRMWTDVDKVKAELQELKLLSEQFFDGNVFMKLTERNGAEIIAKKLGEDKKWTIQEVKLDTKAFGVWAGAVQSYELLKKPTPDVVLAFVDDSDSSYRVWELIRLADGAEIPVKVVREAPPEKDEAAEWWCGAEYGG